MKADHAAPPLGGVSSASCHEPDDAAPSGRADASGDGRSSGGGGGAASPIRLFDLFGVKQAGLISLDELNSDHPDYPRQSPRAALALAKRYSDAGDYRSKHRILAQLLRDDPAGFAVDQPHPAHPGLTHLATGFRVHAPFSLASLAAGKAAKADRPVPADWNDPADREDCPSCHAMHERGDGFCNACGARWPAKTA